MPYMTDFKPGLYVHYTGGYYIALHLVRHHETNERFVVYVNCSHGTVNIREYATPGKDSWTDVVAWGVADGEQRPVRRFHFVKDAVSP